MTNHFLFPLSSITQRYSVFSNEPTTWINSHSTHFHKLTFPKLNSTTVVVRSSLGKPLISPRLLCLFDGQPCMQSQFLIWQRTPGPRVTINFTFNCQQVLITGITRALDVGFLFIFLPVGGKKEEVNRPKEMHIALPSTEISFGV